MASYFWAENESHDIMKGHLYLTNSIANAIRKEHAYTHKKNGRTIDHLLYTIACRWKHKAFLYLFLVTVII